MIKGFELRIRNKRENVIECLRFVSLDSVKAVNMIY